MKYIFVLLFCNLFKLSENTDFVLYKRNTEHNSVS